MTTEATHPDLYGDSDPRVFVTQPDAPAAGRVFVWAETRWFERVGDEDTGEVLFPPLPYDEEGLRGWVQEAGEELTEIDNPFSEMVREEFQDQIPLYPEAPELSDDPTTEMAPGEF